MPGSVHCVRFKKKIVITTEHRNKRGIAGLTFHISPKTKMKYGIRIPTRQIYKQELAARSLRGPVMHPHGRNRLAAGQT